MEKMTNRYEELLKVYEEITGDKRYEDPKLRKLILKKLELEDDLAIEKLVKGSTLIKFLSRKGAVKGNL